MARAPWHLWLVGVIAVLFNGIAAFDHAMSMVQGRARYLESAGLPPAQVAYYAALPPWMTAVWTIGVWSAMLGSVLLLLRRKLAVVAFAVGLGTFLVSLVHTYVLTDGGAVLGRGMAITGVVIAGMLTFFLWYSRWMATRGVLR